MEYIKYYIFSLINDFERLYKSIYSVCSVSPPRVGTCVRSLFLSVCQFECCAVMLCNSGCVWVSVCRCFFDLSIIYDWSDLIPMIDIIIDTKLSIEINAI